MRDVRVFVPGPLAAGSVIMIGAFVVVTALAIF
jgi:hypothetical protein